MKTITEQDSPLTLCYEKHKNLLRAVVWKFIKSHYHNGSDFDELFADACLYFLIAYWNFDEDRGVLFSTWLYEQVYHRLCSQNQRHVTRERKVQEAMKHRADLLPREILSRAKTLDRLSILGEEGNLIFHILIIELDNIERLVHNCTPKNSLRRIYGWLRHRGWDRETILTGFRQLQNYVEADL